MCKYKKILNKIYNYYGGDSCKDYTAYDETTKLFCILHDDKDYCNCLTEKIRLFLFKLFIVNYRKLRWREKKTIVNS